MWIQLKVCFKLDSPDLLTDSIARLQIKTTPFSNITSKNQSHFHSVNQSSLLYQSDRVDCMGLAIGSVDQKVVFRYFASV